jgi:hypothetical protein
MFYELPFFLGHDDEDEEMLAMAAALVALTPAESKRLIAKAVAALPEVRAALKKGGVIIGRGTTNAFVAEEILGITVPKLSYTVGMVCNGELGMSPEEGRIKEYVLRDGQVVNIPYTEMLKEFRAGDVFIKGANAVDTWGNAGVLVAGDTGGTIGSALPTLIARGCHLIVPVGMEKLVPSVLEAAAKCDIYRFKYRTGYATALMPLVTAQVVTEIQALEVLTGVMATHVASGGIGGSEGTVILALEGDEDEVEAAFNLIKSIKGEAPVAGPKKK